MLVKLNCEELLRVFTVNRKEKVEALFVLDMLEGTGLQVLSRRNIQCMKFAIMYTFKLGCGNIDELTQ